jgi:hypothetical protein
VSANPKASASRCSAKLLVGSEGELRKQVIQFVLVILGRLACGCTRRAAFWCMADVPPVEEAERNAHGSGVVVLAGC